jgi:hypothetical protein
MTENFDRFGHKKSELTVGIGQAQSMLYIVNGSVSGSYQLMDDIWPKHHPSFRQEEKSFGSQLVFSFYYGAFGLKVESKSPHWYLPTVIYRDAIVQET